MIYPGLKLKFTDRRDYDLLKSLGATTFDTNSLPSTYSVDAGFPMRDQNAEGYIYGCTGFAQTDLCSNEDKVIYDAGEFYLSTPPGTRTEGRDLRASLELLRTRGPKTSEGVLGPKRTAYYNIRKTPMLDWFDAICVALWVTKDESRAASVAMPWFAQFELAGPTGILPIPPKYTWDIASGHNAVVSGWTDTNTKGDLIRGGEPFLKIKSHQGPIYGDAGWCYLDRNQTNVIFEMWYTDAFTVTKRVDAVQKVDLTFLEDIISRLVNLVAALKEYATKKPAPIPTPPQLGTSQKIYDFAKDCIGTDIAKTQDELGCAEAVSFILSGAAVSGFPPRGFLSTADFYKWLEANAHRVSVGEPGDIIISPTGTSTKGSPHGHVGIVAKYGILSNNSQTGLFDEYYDLTKWTSYFSTDLGFPVLFYRFL